MTSRSQDLILVKLLRPPYLIVPSAVDLELQCQTGQAWGIVLGFLTDDPFFRISTFGRTPSFLGASTIPPPPATRIYRPLYWDDTARAF